MVAKVLLALTSVMGAQAAVMSRATSNSTNYASCAAQMDGKLPSFLPSGFTYSGNTRRYYIAAEEVYHNYAPTGWDNWMGVPFNQSPRASATTNYGTIWLKALYRGYTDETFSNMTTQPPWQGTLGPTIRAEVGDMVEIMFVNKLSKAYATMHSMGLEYMKVSEGGDYPTTSGNNTIPEGDAVPPVEPGVEPNGGCVVYKWLVPASAGSSQSNLARAHSYHSYVDLRVDTSSGLIGPTFIYNKGMMNKTVSEYREIPLLYMAYNEAESFLSGENAVLLSSNHTHGNSTFGSPNQYIQSGNYSVWHPQVTNLGLSNEFSAAPQFFAMNGYYFSNNPTYEMCLNDKVIWYTYAYGSASHVFHMHGNGFQYEGANRYAMSLNDGVGKALYMNATTAGLWQVICHVNNHQQMGMVSNYKVYHNGSCPLPALSSS